MVLPCHSGKPVRARLSCRKLKSNRALCATNVELRANSRKSCPICWNLGESATISSVIWCTRLAAWGISLPGFMKFRIFSGKLHPHSGNFHYAVIDRTHAGSFQIKYRKRPQFIPLHKCIQTFQAMEIICRSSAMAPGASTRSSLAAEALAASTQTMV